MAPFGKVAVGVTPLLQLAARDPSEAGNQLAKSNAHAIAARQEACLIPSNSGARHIPMDCALTKNEAGTDIVVKKTARQLPAGADPSNRRPDTDTSDSDTSSSSSSDNGETDLSLTGRSLKTKKRSAKPKPPKKLDDGYSSSDDEGKKGGSIFGFLKRAGGKKGAKGDGRNSATDGLLHLHGVKKEKRQDKGIDPYKLDSDYTSSDN